jgi:pimeloyl-ACP methyl ester carboxylesterase
MTTVRREETRKDDLMAVVETSMGLIDYEDSGGDGPTVMLLAGLLQDASVWRDVVADLQGQHRCVVPVLPEGAHRQSVPADVELSPASVAELIAELLEVLDLEGVTLVENDSGRLQQVMSRHPDHPRISGCVIASCEAFDNYPPGLPGKTVTLAAKVPGGLRALAAPMRIRALRHLPFAFGQLTRRRIPDELTDQWLRPLLSDPAIAHDLERYLRAVDPTELLEAAERLPEFQRPVLIVWASEDRLMPRQHGERLAELLPDSRLVSIPNSGTLIPLDNPTALADAIRNFVSEITVVDIG